MKVDKNDEMKVSMVKFKTNVEFTEFCRNFHNG